MSDRIDFDDRTDKAGGHSVLTSLSTIDDDDGLQDVVDAFGGEKWYAVRADYDQPVDEEAVKQALQDEDIAVTEVISARNIADDHSDKGKGVWNVYYQAIDSAELALGQSSVDYDILYLARYR